MITDDKATIEKLKFIGLDLEDVPMNLKKISNIDFRPAKNVIEKNYKVYKYINVSDIEILLTPTDRVTDLAERFLKAIPFSAYFTAEDEFEQIKYLNEFLKLVKELEISNVEILEQQQKELAKAVPYKIKFKKDYLWQIYYSVYSDKYFMLVPTKDMDYSALFYVLKKKIENSKATIFVPICYTDYSSNWLKLSEFEQLENYLWFFTKKWPSIYEVFDKKRTNIEITGTAVICENIKTEYKMSFSEEKDLREFFVLLKALFTLQTELSNFYKFKIILDENGKINFYEDKTEITYENIKEYIKSEYVKVASNRVKTKEEKMNLQKVLRNLKNEVRKLDEEYFEEEKFISTFLECKKTFLGRVKYFIKYKKNTVQFSSKKKFDKIDESQKLKYVEKPELKDIYTLDELVIECKQLQSEENDVKNLRLDIDANKNKIEMMDKKISNATKYIKEIDEHKKSIFDFWKFTSQDEATQLSEGEKQQDHKNKIKRAFNFEADFEEVAKQIDRMQRANLSPKEIDSIYITTTNILEDLKNISEGKEIDNAKLVELKSELDNYDKTILGSFDERVKTLGTAKHREAQRNKLAILKISEDMSKEEYIEMLKQILLDLELIIKKSNLTLEMPVYMGASKELIPGYNVFYINADEAIKDINDGDNVYKINFKNNIKCASFTNIVFYTNNNQTLPTGMDVSTGILINTKEVNLKLKSQETNYIVTSIDNKAVSKKINIFEYEA